MFLEGLRRCFLFQGRLDFVGRTSIRMQVKGRSAMKKIGRQTKKIERQKKKDRQTDRQKDRFRQTEEQKAKVQCSGKITRYTGTQTNKKVKLFSENCQDQQN